MSYWKEKKVLVTGGAGFIGSHLCEKLASLGSSITIFDNFSSGRYENIKNILKLYADKVCLLKGDCTRDDDIKKATTDVNVVFHFAANPEVRLELNDPETCFRQNICATYVLLEALRQTSDVGKIIFASTSAVYGDAHIIPTPESYGSLKPVSIYGASKLASEALISSYANLYNFGAVILRFANIIGPRSQHGVIHDFLNKLRKNREELEILGDGTQSKSYLYVDDCISATLTACEGRGSQVKIFNVGSEDWITVLRIAEIVVEEMELKNIKFQFTGGVNGGRGWKGDTKKMLLDISKLKALGWKPKYKSEEAVRQAIKRVLLIEEAMKRA